LKGGNTLRVLVLLALLSLLLTCATPVLAAQEYAPGGDDFESYDVGTYFSTNASAPTPKSNVWGDSGLYTASPARYDKVETAELDGNADNRVVHMVDSDTASTKYIHLRTNFFTTPFQSSGVYCVTMDIKPLQDSGPFKITMSNGAGWTSGGNWLCALGFGSTVSNAYFPGISGAGARLFLQRTTTTAWDETGKTYSANTWYTVKFVVDVDFREYQVFVGPHGGTLSEVTSGPTPWVSGATTPPTTFGGMIIATSGTTGDAAELLVDNVSQPTVLANRIVWDSFLRTDNWQLGTTEDPNHYVWENGYNSLASITGKEMVFGTVSASSDGAFLNNYAPSAVDISARVRSIGGNGAGIAYRKDPTKEAGNPGFAYRLFWAQDGTSVKLSYQWYGVDHSSITYTPTTAIDWTVPHTVRVKALGSSHKVWLDGALIIDWTDSRSLEGGHVIFYRVFSEYHVDDFYMLDTSVSASSVVAVKSAEIGTPVVLSGSGFCVSGPYSGFFYVEDFNRAAGIKVVSPTYVAVGNLVNVTGTVKSADGEKYIDATSVVPDSSSFDVRPLGMHNRGHGTGPGLSDIGLLMRIWGVATWVSGDYTCFYVDDGSGVSYESGRTGIKVSSADFYTPAPGDYVACTGVASMDPGGIPVIRMRTFLDLDIVKPAGH
jgi:hypothetical protein